jgi:putative DNA primase/helicase
MIDLNDTPQQRPFYDVDALSRELAACAARWVPKYFPKGRIDGGEMRLADITGRSPRKMGSCIIQLEGDHAGCFCDFDTGQKGGPLATFQHATGLRGRELLERAAEEAQVNGAAFKSRASAKPKTKPGHTVEIIHILAQSVPAAGTLAERYLAARKLTLPPCGDLLFNPSVTDWRCQLGRPAMIACPRNKDGNRIEGLHRTYLEADGSAKAKDMAKARLTLGARDDVFEGTAVRLYPIGADGRLGIAEGIETAIAAAMIHGVPVWAALSTSGIRNFAMPPDVKELIAFADAGKAGIGAAEALIERASSQGVPARMVVPRSGDDFNVDLMQGLTGDEPAVGAEAAAQEPPRRTDAGRLVLQPHVPLEIAREFAARHIRRLHHNRGAFYAYTGTHYPEIAEDDLMAQLYRFLDGALKRSATGALVPFNPARNKVTEVMHALKAHCNLPGETRAPCWLSRAADLPAEEIIVCTNGLLHLPSGELLPHTPDFFTHNALPFAYDPGAPPPTQWLQFLATLWPDDPESIDTLQEIFGYFLTADTRQQKAFLLIGPKRSGKGTIARVLVRLLGPENCCGPTLASLSQNFGLAPLINKRGAIISDARLSGRVDQHVIVERLLAISGEDALTVDRKFREPWHGSLGVRFLILSNELPKLTDASGTLASRFIIERLKVSFYGREDHGLTARLLGELPGILNWAIAGWRRLTPRGHFVQPKSALGMVDDLEKLVSPMIAFVDERCEVGAGYYVEVGRLFEVFCGWCKEQGRDHPGTKQNFGRELRAALPSLEMAQPRQDDGSRARYYSGIRLKW